MNKTEAEGGAMPRTPREGEEFWRGRARGLLDAAEMLEKCGNPHCQDMAMQVRTLAAVAARVRGHAP